VQRTADGSGGHHLDLHTRILSGHRKGRCGLMTVHVLD